MKIITQDHLIRLGFERNDVGEEESGINTGFYYFTKNFGDSSFCLISNASTDIAPNGSWFIEPFEGEELRTYDLNKLEKLLDVLNQIYKETKKDVS